MARHLIGGGIADWTFRSGADVVIGGQPAKELALVGGVAVTAWNAVTGGVQYTDLLDSDGNPVAQVLSSDGLDGRAYGHIPPLWLPDDIKVAYLSADGGPRVRVVADTTVDELTQPWLVVDGPLLREGVGGRRYRATGYNCYTMRSDADAAEQIYTAANRERFFASLRPNSLVRIWAFKPGGGVPVSQVFAELDAVVSDAKQYGHRLIMGLADWHGTANDVYGPKTALWITGHQWRGTVYGPGSLEEWAATVAGRYASEPAVAIYDLMNEIEDAGAEYTDDLVLYVQEIGGAVKAANPNALVYVGAEVTRVGGDVAYAAINANLDLCAVHDYETAGFSHHHREAQGTAESLNKPMIIDEFGVWAKASYGSAADLDKDTNGLPAVSHRAQALLVENFIRSAFNLRNVAACLLWSAKDTSQPGWYVGQGMYEPTAQAETHQVIRDVDLDGETFNQDITAGLKSWIDGRSALRYPDGHQLATENTVLNRFYDRKEGVNYIPDAADAPIASHRWADGDRPGWQFNGAEHMPIWNWRVGGAGGQEQSCWVVLRPDTLNTGEVHYIYGPAYGVAAPCLRVNGTSGAVELLAYGGAVVGSGGTLAAGRTSIVGFSWDGVSGAWSLWVDLVQVATGTTAATFDDNPARIGRLAGTDGFRGVIYELLGWQHALTAAERSQVATYLSAKHQP